MAKRSRGALYRKTTTRIGRNGKARKIKSGFFRGRYTDNQGNVCDHVLRLPNGAGVKNRDVAGVLLDATLKRLDREAVGMVDAAVENAVLPMVQLVARYIRRKRRAWTKTTTQQTIQQWRWLIGHGITRLVDFLDTDKMEAALDRLADTGVSPRTVNTYRAKAHGFGAWASDENRRPKLLDYNPIDAIKPRDETADTRKRRRSLSVAQVSRLLDVAGPRRLFYHVLAWTGLRVSEAAALEWRDLIGLDTDRPEISSRVYARKTKVDHNIPIHPSLVSALQDARPQFAGPTDRVFAVVPRLRTFKGGWQSKKRKRTWCDGDLQRASIAVVDDHGDSVDLHALKTTFANWLMEYNVPSGKADMLTRHGSGRGTRVKHYVKANYHDLHAEIAKLPGPQPSSEQEQERLTGTDGGVAL